MSVTATACKEMLAPSARAILSAALASRRPDRQNIAVRVRALAHLPQDDRPKVNQSDIGRTAYPGIAMLSIRTIAAALVLGASGRAARRRSDCATLPKPNGLGVARSAKSTPQAGQDFGMEQYKMHDFLLLKEVVLTFDDGPWPDHTRAVLAALAHHCTKATFFPIGKHALGIQRSRGSGRRGLR